MPGAYIDKHFYVWIGLGTARPWDRPKKIERKKSKRHQFAFRKDTYTPLWVEYVPVEGDNELIPDFKPTDLSVNAGRGDDKRHMKRWRQKEERAYTMIYEIDDDLIPQEKASKPVESTPNWWKESQKAKKESQEVDKKAKTKRGWDMIDLEEEHEWDDDWKTHDSKKKASTDKKHSSRSKSSNDKDQHAAEWKSSSARSTKDHDWQPSDWKSETWQEQQSLLDWAKPWKKTSEPSGPSSSQPWAKEEKEKLRDHKYKKMKDVLSKEGEPFQSEEETLPPWRKTKTTVEAWREDHRDDRASGSDSSWSAGKAWSREKVNERTKAWGSLWSTN